MSVFIPKDVIFTLSIADGEKFFDNACAKSLLLYTHGFAPVTATFIPLLYLAT